MQIGARYCLPHGSKYKENKVNSRKIFLTAMLAGGCLFSSSAVRAQGTAAPAAGAASGKIGVINVRQAIVATSEGKQASAELQSQFAARQSELENMNKQIADLRQRLESGKATLSQEEQARLTRQGEILARQLQRKQDEYQEDVNAAQGDVIDRIGRKMIDVLDRYARENGYVAVLDSSAQNTPILYASNQIDVTQDIVRLYDTAYPVKAGAAATTPKPAAKPAQSTPKPATQPPAAKP
jgi:outer membrane protein